MNLSPAEREMLLTHPPREGAPADAAPNDGATNPWLWSVVGVIVLITFVAGALVGFTSGRIVERRQPVVVIPQPVETQPPIWGPYEEGRLGVVYRMLKPGDPFAVSEGALIVSLLADEAPAGMAGLEPGDIITRVDGRALGDSRTLSDALAGIAAGERVTLTIDRAGERFTVRVRLDG